MSADKKLNKYLAKLKNTHDVKDAKVYINKIMKYKHMAGKQSGGAAFGEVTEPIQRVDTAASILANLSDPDLKSKLTTVIQENAGNAISSGYTDDLVASALGTPFSNIKQLLGSIGKLNTDNVPTLGSITEIIQTASKDLGTGEQKSQADIDKLIQDIWDEKYKTTEAPPEAVPVKKDEPEVEEVEQLKGKGQGPVARQLSPSKEFVSDPVHTGGRRKK